MKTTIKYLYLIIAVCTFVACGNSKKTLTEQAVAVGPDFNADSAYAYCAAQCAFGPRMMNTAAHDSCGSWIAAKFSQYGMKVSQQKTVVRGYDGTQLNCTNIIASFRPEATERVLLCAHWDSRPWADNDPDSANWHKPVMGANDGASGVGVMIEIARLLQQADSLKVGVDFVCFDAEDWGTPQWSNVETEGDTWALGAHYWSEQAHKHGYKARFGILLDMVGGAGATFYREAVSQQYANAIVEKVWAAAKVAGYSSIFPDANGGMITDDHVPVNEKANIPCVDIIPFYADCEQSSFGPTWHTVNDTMDNIDRNILKAVGQTVVQVLFSEK